MAIFLDRGKLSPHYVPEVLPHREKQIQELFTLFKDILSQPYAPHFRVMQIVGSVGTGKTCSAIRFGERFQSEARKLGVNLTSTYINLKLHGGSRVILYRYLVQQMAPELYSTSLGAEELLHQLVSFLGEKKKLAILILDEIDYFLRHSKETRVVYDLTRLDEMIRPGKPSGIVGLVFIARGREFYKELDQAEASSLGRIPLEFRPYTSEQIQTILEARASESFTTGAVAKDILELIADITAGPEIAGDIRYALDLLLFAGELAEREGRPKVQPEDVRKIVNETLPSITTEDVLNLPEAERVVLLGAVRALRSRRTAYVSLRDIRSSVSVLCEERKLKPVTEVEEYLQDLHDRSLVDVKSLTSIGISGVSTESLGNFLDRLFHRLEGSVGKRQGS